MSAPPASGASRLFKGLLGRGDDGGAGAGAAGGLGLGVLGGRAAKDSRAEFARARTRESQYILVQKTPRDVEQTTSGIKLEARPRGDWEAIWRSKVTHFRSLLLYFFTSLLFYFFISLL
jgi:hypothetical protein